MHCGTVTNPDRTRTSTDDRIVKPREFSALLAQLPCLKVLTLELVSIPLVQVLLDDESTIELVTNLETLNLSVFSISVSESFDDVSWVRQVARMPSLRSFTLERFGQGMFLPRMATRSQGLVPPAALLTKLCIMGDVFSLWEDPNLGALAPNLVDLELEDHEWCASFAAVLRTAPVGLRRLILRAQAMLPSSDVVEPVECLLDDVLPRFLDLEHLELCQCCFTPASLLSYLRSLTNLRTLAFGEGALADDALLRSILVGPHRLHSLRRLTLVHVYIRCGSTYASKGWQLPPVGDDFGNTGRMWGTWVRPLWPAGCTQQGLDAALQAAQTHGVVAIDGSALEATACEEAYDGERRMSLLLVGDETGDYCEARRVLGDDVVDEYLLGKMHGLSLAVEGGRRQDDESGASVG